MKSDTSTETIETSTLEKISEVISGIFHPLIIPLAAFLLLIIPDQKLNVVDKLTFIAITLTFSWLLILLYILYLKKTGEIESTDIKIREQRLNPLTIAIIFYLIGFVCLFLLNSPPILQGLMFCYASNTLVVLLITNYWKVSIHTTSISGPSMALFFQYGAGILPFFIFIPMVAISRVIMKRHTIGQVIAGVLIGLGFTYIQLYYLFNITPMI
jgi:membrane-associated phospholipid phosphatase